MLMATKFDKIYIKINIFMQYKKLQAQYKQICAMLFKLIERWESYL